MSLLLDALKQAEKAKQERSGEGRREEPLEVERPEEKPGGTPPREPAAELSIEPIENDLGSLPEQEDRGEPERDRDRPFDEGMPEADHREGKDLDIEALASRLSDATGRFSRRPEDDQLTPQADSGQFDPDSATMPSMKSVQQSLKDFYDGTDKISADDVTSEMAARQKRDTERTGETTRVSHRDAQTVFEAKRGRKPAPRRRTWVLLGVMLLLLVVGAGGYLWIETSGITTVRPPVARAPVTPRPAPAPEVVATAPAQASASAMAQRPPATAPASRPAMTPQETLAAATTPQPAMPDTGAGGETAEAAAAAAAAPPAGEAQAPPIRPAPAQQQQPAVQRAAAGAGRDRGAEALPIRVARRPARDPNYRRAREAYDQFRDGDLGAAAATYRAVLKADPQNRDALLGLGAIALKEGRTGDAQQLYLRLLALNPQDRLALAALTSLHTIQDPVKTESRLKLLLDKAPEEGYLHFALGNVYAAQNRWPEAQAAFFNAYRTDKGNPDYAFNLAVSLDQLGQAGAALGLYREALEQADGKSASFDRARVARRIESLSARAGADS